ncbi:PilZ domain-containing protein [Kiloniella antarctica]|uniref:PilZ domain-containing protein n=1 Tax=Kiloniella antarctica TaxID=1550907 RepID=A0ABW5BNS9_9PROT
MYQEFSSVSLQRLLNRRHTPRQSVFPGTKVQLTVFNTKYDCEILDLSFCGARLMLDTKLPIGSEIILSHEDCGQVLGIVKWNSQQEIGLELNPGVGRLLSRYGNRDANIKPSH